MLNVFKEVLATYLQQGALVFLPDFDAEVLTFAGKSLLVVHSVKFYIM